MVNLLIMLLAFLPMNEPLPRDLVYMPQVSMGYREPPIRGAQDETKALYGIYPPGSFYHINIRWDKVEATKGVYAWDSATDKAVREAKERGLSVIIGTRASPKWARKYPDKLCSQPKEGNYDEYAGFVAEIVKRYHPWGVEIWNEPDALPQHVPNDMWQFGCFDNGKAYSDMLEHSYHAVKHADPYVRVLAGALSMGDDNWLKQWLTLPNGATHIDYISFHAYAYWGGNNNDVALKNANMIRKYGNWNLLLTETSLLDTTENCNSRFETAKAEYAAYVVDNYEGWDIDGVLWYTIGGNNWRCSDLTGASVGAWWGGD